MDANNPNNYGIFQKSYDSRNAYDAFNVLNNRKPEKQYYAVVAPDYVTVTYQFVIYNSIGQFIESNYGSEVQLSHLERGVYFIQFPQISSKIFKIVKQ